MTRNGKIARLPRAIREQLNCRLEDGVPGVELVAWLNAQSEVRKVLAEFFGKKPINEQNLSDWRQGGFLDWQKHQEVVDLARQVADNADDLQEVAGEPLSDKASALLAARYMLMLKSLGANAVEPVGDSADWKFLRELCRDLVALRKGDHTAERIKNERERIRWGI